MRKYSQLIALCASASVGCGDNVLSSEGGPDADGPTLVTIRTGAQPALIALRDEASTAWRALAPDGTGTFQVVTTGPYRVIVACAYPASPDSGTRSSVQVAEYARTPEDGRMIEHECRPSAYPFALRGRMAQPGLVSFGKRNAAGTEPDWEFELPTSRGTFDLVMLSGDLWLGFDEIAIRRDIPVASDMQLGTIDLSQENTAALIPVSFTTTNLRPGELTSSVVRLDTGSTTEWLQVSEPEQRSGWTTTLAPESLLRTTDRQWVELSTIEESSGEAAQSRNRNILRNFRVGDPTSVTLPEPLGPVTFEMSAERLTATWSTLPEHDDVSLSRWSYEADTGFRVQYISLSRTFLEATGAASATLDLRDVPGFRSEWHIDPAGSGLRGFSAIRRTSAEIASSSVHEQIEPMASMGAAMWPSLLAAPERLVTGPARPRTAGTLELTARPDHAGADTARYAP